MNLGFSSTAVSAASAASNREAGFRLRVKEVSSSSILLVGKGRLRLGRLILLRVLTRLEAGSWRWPSSLSAAAVFSRSSGRTLNLDLKLSLERSKPPLLLFT